MIVLIGFGFNEFSRDGSYELYTYVDVDYNTSKAIISTRINTDYNINKHNGKNNHTNINI